ncbi:MAG: hypothetical protein U0836_12530 [Pirellulales bacterium]
MNRHEFLLNDSVRTYERLLYLYPRELRREFGREMCDLFRAQLAARLTARGALGLIDAWKTVLRELPATVVREHWAVLERRNPGVSWNRLAAAALLPLLGAVAWRWTRLEPPPGYVAMWLATCVLPALTLWGRGWASVLAAMRGSATAASLAILWGSLHEGPGMPVHTAVVLVACAATAGLAVGVVVRSIVEGLAWRSAPTRLVGTASG